MTAADDSSSGASTATAPAPDNDTFAMMCFWFYCFSKFQRVLKLGWQ
jgi:hypothetical protein